MITSPTTISKISIATELICPMFKSKLIEQAIIVGSVAKGTAKPDSDIDIYLINPLFKLQEDTHKIDLPPSYNLNTRTHKIVDLIISLGGKHEFVDHKEIGYLSFWRYKNELIHFMYDYESESIKKGGNYIEITEEICDEIGKQ